MVTNLTECYKLHTLLGKIYGNENRDALLKDDWSDKDILQAAENLIKQYQLNEVHHGGYSVPAFQEGLAKDLVRFYNDLANLVGSAVKLDWLTNSYGGQNHIELIFVH